MLPEPTPMEYTMEHFQEDLRSSAYVGGSLGTVATITNTTSTATTTTITTTSPTTTTKDDKAIVNSGQLVETAVAAHQESIYLPATAETKADQEAMK
ncbi:hypothetical protein TYRP_016316 [Tyrophagus putrescentiae]|nr:hypothetical protein TYRP_016316 [Tyrophagus putrescentiae]